MALRSLTTRMWGPAAAYALRRHPVPGVPTPPSALFRFLGTTRGQGKMKPKFIAPLEKTIIADPAQSGSSLHWNDIGTRRRSIDVEHIRGDLKRYKIEDEIMRENIRWGSRFYKTLEWSSYVILSVSAAGFTACEVIVRSIFLIAIITSLKLQMSD